MLFSRLPALTVRFVLGPGALLTAALAVALLLPGCTPSSSSSDNSSPDSSGTSPTTAVADAPPPEPADPAIIEEADERSVAQKLEDASIETRVKRALVRTSNLRIFPFRPRVVNGHLVLRGDVNTADQYRQAERIASRVDGVTNVTNRLTMGGRAVTDERLASEEDSSEKDAVYHTVQQGDTLWDIAREYRASVEQIKNLNDFGAGSLRPGERIRIR